jgi:hypothetical protein
LTPAGVLSAIAFLYITGTDIVVDGGWFSVAPYLTNERSHHLLQILDAKDKVNHVLDDFLKYFR